MSLLIFVMPKMFAEKVDDLKSLFQKNAVSMHHHWSKVDDIQFIYLVSN